MKNEYRIVTAKNVYDLCTQVEEMLDAGFVCQGGVWYGPLETRGGMYMQSMTREREVAGETA